MDTRQLKRHFRDAINYLDRNYAYFLTNVLSIGRPQWTSAVLTAAVALDHANSKMPNAVVNEDDYNFMFIFNPEFAEGLDTETMAFVLAHETMHIILNHLKLVSNFLDKDRYEVLRQKSETGTLSRDELKETIKMQQVAAKFNIAADCVINDFLAQMGMSVMDKACRGEHFIGEDAAFLTVTDVYERLPDNPQSQDGDDDGEGNGQSMDGDGRGTGAVDDHGWMFDPNFADKVADAIDKLNEDIEKKNGLPQDLKDKRDEEAGKDTQAKQQLNKSMRAGSEEGNMRAFQEQAGLSMAWVKLLKEVDPDMFKEPGIAPPPAPAWHKRPRKLGATAFRDVNLPVYKKDTKREKRSNEKPAIVMALDYSGSIGPHDADRFATLARSIPQERIKLFCCSFTTTYRKFDLDNPHGGGSGGTSFDAITSFIENEVKSELGGKYPKAVLVITDGEASLSPHNWPTEAEAESWFWLISPYDRSGSYYPASNQIGRRAMLTEYIV